MERLRLERGYFRTPAGEPVYLLGANYWPQKHGPWMYSDPWNGDEVSAEFRQIAALGCNVVRVFCFTPHFLVSPDAVDDQALRRLESLVALAAEHNLWSIPTFLVGHMSGENWEPAWSSGRNWHSDELVLAACPLLIHTIAERFAGDPRIAAWLLTNEWPLFAGSASERDAVMWAKRLCGAVRSVDPSAALSLGDGAWDIISGQNAALPARTLADFIDFYGPHFYPKETDALRHSVFAPFAMRMTETFGKPVLLEEFGCSSDQADDDFAADYYRTVLWSAFGAGNCGALFWNSHDFPLADRRPYAHHPYELHFGVIRSDGSAKPQADEVARFARFVDMHPADDWQPEPARAAIGRSAYYFETFPFDWGWTKPQLRDLYLQAYACATMAGVDVGFTDLSAPVPADVRLIYVPCLQQVTAGDAAQLENFVRNGGCVYLSHGGEPWFPNLAEFIGVRLRIRYGLVEAPRREARWAEQLTLRLVGDIGDLTKGSVLQMPLPEFDRRAAAMPCTPEEAAVLAVDEGGNPALFVRKLGAGFVIFMAYPLEYIALQGFDGNARNGAWKIYRAIAQNFGAIAPLRAQHPCVQSFVWHSRLDAELHRLVLVNHTWDEVTTKLTTSVDAARDIESGQQLDPTRIVLPRKGVRALEFRH